ncbi:hypothetical protein SAMN04489810_2243 [Microbacterium pygmaeum]|uniref:Uncharacterized protein n=1 Tax=Microbacterium pygmaeum TaxID=370764 RepID=A0A1G8A242_9MICO|nr:hypothetical protein SAMN04489810_2243 [Microbacterium pygmaeum]
MIGLAAGGAAGAAWRGAGLGALVLDPAVFGAVGFFPVGFGALDFDPAGFCRLDFVPAVSGTRGFVPVGVTDAARAAGDVDAGGFEDVGAAATGGGTAAFGAVFFAAGC